MDICVQVGASGAVVHLKSSKIHQFLLFLLKTRDSHLFEWPADTRQLAVMSGAYPLVSPLFCAEPHFHIFFFCAKTFYNANQGEPIYEHQQTRNHVMTCHDQSSIYSSKSTWS